MLRKMGTGLLVTELMGQGTNYVTGDYSRGASGYWVENGVIQYPVEEITIAGNMKDMFQADRRHRQRRADSRQQIDRVDPDREDGGGRELSEPQGTGARRLSPGFTPRPNAVTGRAGKAASASPRRQLLSVFVARFQ